MCIDAQDSTTNYLSSGFFEDGAGNDQTFESEKNVLLSLSLSIRTFFDKSHASLREVSSCVLSSIFWSFRTSLVRFTLLNISLRWTLSFPNFLRGEANLLRNARCAFIPRILCSSQKSTWISAAQNPGIRNPYASHDSSSQQIVFHNFSLAFCWADCQPQCA